MKLEFGMICDYASISENGKLNILGVFNTITSPIIPFIHPQMHAVLKVIPPEEAVGKEFTLKLSISHNTGEADQKPFWEAPHLTLNQEHELETAMNLVLAINTMRFNKYGEWLVSVELNSEYVFSLPLSIIEDQKPGTS